MSSSSVNFNVSFTTDKILKALEDWSIDISKDESKEDVRKIKCVARSLPDLAKSMELKAFCRLTELAREKEEELSRKRNIK
eukprot:11088777-Ditylum_brightwellii.AAC.1